MFDADARPAMRIGPARNVTCRKNIGIARLQMRVHGDAAIDREPRLLREVDARTHTDPGDHEIGFECTPTLELHAAAFDCDSRVLEVELDAALLVQFADEVAHLRP